MKLIAPNLGINEAGHLTFAGLDTAALAEKYGTPLYLMDEDTIRSRCRLYLTTLRAAFGDSCGVLYASKAASYKRLYAIMAEEGMGVDVVSAGEIFTARSAGFPLERAYFHGNCKTDEDIDYALACGVGTFVVDGWDELEALERLAAARGVRQRILLRITPGIDPHTYEAVNTGRVDSKFGTPLETGQALELLRFALTLPHIDLQGFHCHVGSQVFEEDVFQRTAEIMLRFFALVRKETGFVTREFNMGGGYGVRYVESDGRVDIAARLTEVADAIKATAAELKLPLPKILIEPGRSIVADAGLTLYTVGSVKRIPGFRNYVSVDGGMTDNPRYALYGSRYTVYAAGRMNEAATERFDVVGRCCESGDILQPGVPLPALRRGELLAVCTTGAYHYSMASNYNRIPRPPVVMLRNRQDSLAVRRESREDLLQWDV